MTECRIPLDTFDDLTRKVATIHTIEITEDNCVLDKSDNEFIADIFSFYAYRKATSIEDEEKLFCRMMVICGKIHKLNEIVKTMKTRKKIDYDMHVCTGEPPF